MNKQELYQPRFINRFLLAATFFCIVCAVAYLAVVFVSLDGFQRILIGSLSIALVTIVGALVYFLVASASSSINKLKHNLDHQSVIDTLTAVYTRHWFLKRYQEEYDRAIRYNHNLAIIMVDIDHFNDLNRNFGTTAGDLGLQTLAELLRTACRTSDLIARYGSDSFAILIPEGDTAGTLVLAEKLRNNVAASAVQIDGTDGKSATLQFTVSVGMACMDNSIVSSAKQKSDLIAQAEAALYRAKHVGRNRVMGT